MRIKLTLSYDGTAYSGWQIQPNALSVQKTVEQAIFSLTNETVTVTASGRTDAGVHATAQTCHFDTACTIPPEKFYLALNTVLPPDVRAIRSEEVSEDFDARKSAKKKTYKYSFYFDSVENPLKERYATLTDKNLNYREIKKAIKLIKGEHDFKAFSSTGSSVKTTVRTVYEIKMVKNRFGLEFYVTGSGFLYNMVRIIVGALIKVGKGKISLTNIKEMLTTGKRVVSIETLPAKGLTLVGVKYV